MTHDPFAYDIDELVGPGRGSTRPIIIGLATMLGIGVLSAMVLMEPPMARSYEVTDEERLARMLALAPPAEDRPAAPAADEPTDAPLLRTRDVGEADRRPAEDHAGGAVQDILADVPSPPVDPARERAGGEPSATLADEPARMARTDASDAAAAVRPPAPPETATAKAPSAPAASVTDPVREVSATAEAASLPAITAAPARTPAPREVPMPGQAADGPFAIQFGAMSTREAAEREIARMRLAAPGLFARVETSIETTRLDDGREVNRMRIAGVTRKAEARAWCRAFKAQGGSCYVVG